MIATKNTSPQMVAEAFVNILLPALSGFRRIARFLSAALMLTFSIVSSAQIIDQIEYQPEANGEKEVVLKFLTDVSLVRYSPEKEGSIIKLYFLILGDQTPLLNLPREFLTSPANGIPRFTVSFPEPDSSLSLSFSSPVTFRVRQIRGSRTISIFVKTYPAIRNEKLEEGGNGKAAAPVAGLPGTINRPAGSKTVEPKPVPGIPDVLFDNPPANAASSAPPATSGAEAPRPTFSTLEEAAAAARAESAAIASPSAASAAEDTAPVPLAQVEEKAQELLVKAKKALAANDAPGAVKLLNILLNLPTNKSSREAQKLMGEAREKNNELVKAKGEYELFIRLYPEGPDADYVRQRLAKMPAMLEQQAAAAPRVDAQGKPVKPSWTVTGSFSQYHYSGNSHIEILTPPPPGLVTFNQQTLSMTDQNSIISNLDLMARLRSGTTDTRIVVRDSYTKNALRSDPDPNRLSAAYIEQTDQKEGYQYRLGKQSGTYGSIGLFDGAYGSYQISPDYRINGTMGTIDQFGVTSIKRNVYGTGLEKIPKLGQIGGTLYIVRQTADGYLDRHAVGVEARYFDSNKSAFSMFDYDIAFKKMNLIMLQGNYRMDEGTNFYLLSDTRRSPMLQLTNALPAATSPPPNFFPATNITEALLNSGLSVSDLRKWADDVTATSHLFSTGVTHPLTQRWQVGADYGRSSITSMVGAGSIPAQPGSGTTTTYNFQLIGNILFFESDNAVFNTTEIEAPTYKGQNYNVNYGASWFNNKFRTDLGLRFYRQKDKEGMGKMDRFSPTLRMSYLIRPSITLEAETGSEKSNQTDSSGTKVNSDRVYFYMGYRWTWQ